MVRGGSREREDEGKQQEEDGEGEDRG